MQVISPGVSVMGKRNMALISAASILLLVASVVLYYYLKPGHDAIPVYKQIPEDVFKPYFEVGQVRYFTKGTLHCESLEAIKRYYDHMNERNLGRVFLLMVSGDCNYAGDDRVYAVLDEVTGMFARVTPRNTDDTSPRWMPVIELIRD